MHRRIAAACVVLGVIINLILIGTVFADIKVVDPSGGGDYLTIQAAVNGLPDPGPRTIIVRAGTYHEAVLISTRNTRATNDSQRIIIMADTNTASGSVIVTPPSGSSGMNLSRSRFITVQGLAITGASGKTVPAITLTGGSKDNEDIAIVGCEISGNGSHGIQIGQNNPRTWLMNNLIHDNGSNSSSDDGVTIAAGSASTVYLINNTIVRSKFDGVFVQVPRVLYMVNNLIVGNGGYGLQCASKPVSGSMTLLNNVFYANAAGDIALASQTLDATDSGNRTTAGNEAVGIAGCTFTNCSNAASLANIFVNPGGVTPDFHQAAGSPVIDRGVNSFSDWQATWEIAEDLDGNARPKDGLGDCIPIVDVGCYEAPAVVPCHVTEDGLATTNLLAAVSNALAGAFATMNTIASNFNLATYAPMSDLLGKADTNQNVSLFPNDAGYLTASALNNLATINGTYPGMTVGTATFAATASNVLSFGNTTPDGYVKTDNPMILNGLTNLYATGSGTVTVNGNAGTINFGAVALSNVLAVGNVSGTGIVMSAKDATNSHGLFFVDSSGDTNQFRGSGSNVVHIAPSGATGTVWDAINLPYPASTNGIYPGMTVGTATNAQSLNGVAAAGYATTNGSYQNMNVGTALFATSTGTATNCVTCPTAAITNGSVFLNSSGNLTGIPVIPLQDTEAHLASVVPQPGEAAYATDSKNYYVGDGTNVVPDLGSLLHYKPTGGMNHISPFYYVFNISGGSGTATNVSEVYYTLQDSGVMAAVKVKEILFNTRNHDPIAPDSPSSLSQYVYNDYYMHGSCDWNSMTSIIPDAANPPFITVALATMSRWPFSSYPPSILTPSLTVIVSL